MESTCGCITYSMCPDKSCAGTGRYRNYLLLKGGGVPKVFFVGTIADIFRSGESTIFMFQVSELAVQYRYLNLYFFPLLLLTYRY
jgi:hypothetical protein